LLARRAPVRGDRRPGFRRHRGGDPRRAQIAVGCERRRSGGGSGL